MESIGPGESGGAIVNISSLAGFRLLQVHPEGVGKNLLKANRRKAEFRSTGGTKKNGEEQWR
jgi:hypothetical protein